MKLTRLTARATNTEKRIHVNHPKGGGRNPRKDPGLRGQNIAASAGYRYTLCRRFHRVARPLSQGGGRSGSPVETEFRQQR